MALDISPANGLPSEFSLASSSNQRQTTKPRRYVSVEQTAFWAEHDRLLPTAANWHHTRGRPRRGTKSFIVELSRNLGICTRTAANFIADGRPVSFLTGGAK
jgi:hypothetical protein